MSPLAFAANHATTAEVHEWWWRGNGWPHVNPLLQADAVDGTAIDLRALHLHEFYTLDIGGNDYSDDNWDPVWFARAILQDFAPLFGARIASSGDLDVFEPPAPAAAGTSFDEIDTAQFPSAIPFEAWSRTREEELIELISLAEYRPAMIGEGIEQSVTFDQFFAAILSFNRNSHPATTKLVAIGLEVGTHVAMTYKLRHQRPRPSHLCPALMPPIDPPEHASYPSGHATQAWLVAHLLNEATGRKLDPDGTVTLQGQDERRNPLHDMAARIARNREVMGLHYPSDSEAGRRLAYAAYRVLTENLGRVQNLVNTALGEWLTPDELQAHVPTIPQHPEDPQVTDDE
ncbi:hypothetical protein AB9K41_11930 [Cribrihabitans sp. XS_ASV171]